DSLPQSSISSAVDQGVVSGDMAFQQSLTDLFRQTGDGLSVPRTIFVHTNQRNDETLRLSIEVAAKAATGINHKVVITDTELFANDASMPPFLAILGFVFHHDLYEDRYLDEYKNVLK